MPARNLERWNTIPGKIQDGEYVDSRIYSDENIFKEEIKRVFMHWPILLKDDPVVE